MSKHFNMTSRLSENLDSIFKKILSVSNEDSGILSDRDRNSTSEICSDVKLEKDNKNSPDNHPYCSSLSKNGENTSSKDPACKVAAGRTENPETAECPVAFSNDIWEQLLTTDPVCREASILELVKVFDSPGATVDTKYKVLDYLSKETKRDSNLLQLILPGQLINFTENLLKDFCDAFLKHTKNAATEEICLLKPSLEVLIPATKMSVQMINSIFLIQSDFLYNLVQAVSLCCNNIARTIKKLNTLTRGKCLFCICLPLSPPAVRTSFEMCFNIKCNQMTSKLQGSQVIIFDKVDGSFYRNINEEIVKYQPYINGIYNYYDDNINIEADRQCVEVIHILPPNYVLMYLDPHWKEHLVEISSKVHQLVLDMRTSSGKANTFRRGQFVGFCSSEARFEGEALIMMSYLRAEVLSVIGDQAMLWPMDIGLLTYCPVEKLCLIEDETLLSQKPLVSLAALKGPICEYDDDFLELALRLLKDILKPSAQQGKHMFLSDTGEDILILMEHPNNQVRIHVLDIILHLANHCQEVRLFLEKQKFDLNLAGKLERYVHCYGSDLCPSRTLLRIEMIIIAKIFSTLFEDKVDLQNWPGKEQTVTALKMILEETDVQPTYVFRNCLRQLIGKATASSQNNNRGEHGGVCMKGPHRQGFSRQWSRKQDSNGIQFRKNESSKGGDARIRDMKITKELYSSNNNSNGKDSHCLDHCESSIPFEKTERDKKSINGYYQSYDDSLKTFMECGKKAVEEEEKSLSGQVDYLIRGSTVDVKSDQTHHLMEEKEVHDLQEMKLAQVLCGLLNNNVESYMYFGISEDSVVEGMLLTRDNRDVFRNGVDRTMSKSLLPEVQLSAYDIIFTPVIRPGDKVIALAKKALFVIEIRVRPLRHMVYALHQCRKCYVRRDAETLESTITQKKNYMIEMEEKALDDATNSIREISQGYLAILASFIDKYLSKENYSVTENTE